MSIAARAPHREGRSGRAVWPETALLALASAAVLAVISQFFPSRGRPGLELGTGDHVVLAPRGMSWADPSAFAGDWFTQEAPQPHWLFDYVIQAGWGSGHLVRVLVAYWVLTCLVFGLATAWGARAWASGRTQTWLAALAVSALAALMPFSVAGSTWLAVPLAVPNMLGAALLYLLTVLLATGRPRALVAVLPILSAVHVQIGAIGLVLCVLALGAQIPVWRRHRPPARALASYAVSALVSAALIVGAMRARSVAAERRDFVEICNTLIPYHCAAATWSPAVLLVAVGAALLALTAVALIAPRLRLRYLVTVGVCAVGTLAAIALDRGHVPVLGELTQALNGYRVALALYPWACWGVLVPFLRPAVDRPRSVAAAAAVAGVPLLFCGSFGKIAFADADLRWRGWAWAALAAYLLLVVAAALLSRRTTRSRPLTGAAALAGLLVWLVATGAASGVTFTRSPAPVRWGDAASQAWGQAVREVIPADVQVVIPPTRAYYRLPLQRGVVADCKDIPYGGAAYRSWKERLGALGGVRQCPSDTSAYDALPAADLIGAAERFGAGAIIVVPGEEREQVRGLVTAGWSYREVSAGWVKAGVLLRPGLSPGR